MPFHLQALGYTDISALVGYLLFAYVRIDRTFYLNTFTNFGFLSATKSSGLALCTILLTLVAPRYLSLFSRSNSHHRLVLRTTQV